MAYITEAARYLETKQQKKRIPAKDKTLLAPPLSVLGFPKQKQFSYLT
jgi:hypothetical protein